MKKALVVGGLLFVALLTIGGAFSSTLLVNNAVSVTAGDAVWAEPTDAVLYLCSASDPHCENQQGP